MVLTIFWIIVALAIIGVVFWGCNEILNQIPMPQIVKTVIYVLMVILTILVVVKQITPLVPAITHTISK